MARPRNHSIVQVPPKIKGFIPLGYYARESEPVEIHIEEYEVIRLLDYENLSQNEAAKYMKISRPTLTRIYDRARKKVAMALTEVHPISIEGGQAIYEGEWYKCDQCESNFNNPGKRKMEFCPLCGNTSIININELK